MVVYHHAIDRASRVELSVIVPVYQCADTLIDLHRRLAAVLSRLVASYEIVFVDDRARDGAWSILERLAENDACVVAIRLSRNVGQQLAITAGLEQCCGAYAIVMDCDLQDPPEAIPALYARAQEGFDIVFAKRKGAYQSKMRTLANRLYVSVLTFVSRSSFDGELGAFSIVSRRVIEAFLRFPDRERQYLLILLEVGFESTTVEYTREHRRSGRSSFNFVRLVAHALSGLLFATTRLLYLAIHAGSVLFGSGLLLACVLIARWIGGATAPGWAIVVDVLLLVGGIITICIGINGLYLGRILRSAHHRPLYFVQDRIDRRSIAQARTNSALQS
jgi:glycosyltransferase involved in cell wall biosynthesis